MNRKHSIPLAILLIAGLGVVGLTNTRADDDDAVPDNTPVPTLVTVETGALKQVTLHRYVPGFGMIEPAPATPGHPAASAQLAAPSAGVVIRVNVAEGQHVTKGEILAELNSSAMTLENATQQLKRQKELYAQQNTSLKNLQDAEAQVALLRVTAPLSGTVVKLNVKPGQAVDVTTVVAELMDLQRLAVSADIPAGEARELKTGQKMELLTDSTVSTKLSYVSPLVNKENGTVLTRGLLSPDSGLRPGQFVPLRVVTEVHTNVLAAPALSVVTDEDGHSVIALVTGDMATQTPVKTGVRENGWVEVTAPGLKAGDTVVTTGAYGLPDKTKIRVENTTEGKAPSAKAPTAP